MDVEELAAELVATGRLRPYPQWAGGEVLAAVKAAANAQAMEAMF